MSEISTPAETSEVPTDRPTMNVDIACVGFGPAMGGFLTTLTQAWRKTPTDPAFVSKTEPGSPLRVLCCERADDLSAGVSGLVTRAESIRESFPRMRAEDIPMAAEIKRERLLYLLDPHGVSRRSLLHRAFDFVLRRLGGLVGVEDFAFPLPWIPKFLRKRDGLILSIGQFNKWVGEQINGDELVQICCGTPVSSVLTNGDSVTGIRLSDQGVDAAGVPQRGYLPGIDVHAALTVIGDGAEGSIGREVDELIGLPPGHARHDYAIGMKMVIELPAVDDNPAELNWAALVKDGVLADIGIEVDPLEAGTVWHTFGFPEPEMSGFLYVHPQRLITVGILVPSTMSDPARTAYRYLQHFIQHPALWRYLKDGKLRSWGAKSLQRSGKSGEPFWCGDGYARIGESSGSSNPLTGSGVDEAWATGVQLAEAVLEIRRADKAFSQENLTAAYGARRRASKVERGACQAENALNGFHRGFLRGVVGFALAGLTKGHFALAANSLPLYRQIRKPRLLSVEGIQRKLAAADALKEGRTLHDALLSLRGWPEVGFDGGLLIPHEEALTLAKVHAPAGFADHVVFVDSRLCERCDRRTCISMCSGLAITSGDGGIPVFHRERCIHCGACLWNCTQSSNQEDGNIRLFAGAGGLHSSEN